VWYVVGMGGNRGRDEIFAVECCVTLHCDWPILKVRKIGETELATPATSATEKVSTHVGFYTKNGQFHPLIPPPTTELKIR